VPRVSLAPPAMASLLCSTPGRVRPGAPFEQRRAAGARGLAYAFCATCQVALIQSAAAVSSWSEEVGFGQPGGALMLRTGR
jgi:hypothetical protein